MSKLAWFQFYPRDWLSDPDLAQCSALTHGVWINLLASMHTGERSELTGTIGQLARLGRCTESEMTRFIAEAEATNFCDVTECHDLVTVSSRRLKRDERERKSAVSRQRKHREAVSDSAQSSERHADVTAKYQNVTSDSVSDSSLDQSSDTPETETKKHNQSPLRLQQPEWDPDDLWLRNFLAGEQKVFNSDRLPLLLNPDFWSDLSTAINGLDLPFVRAEFAKMAIWKRDNPARAPTRAGVRRFVASWFCRAANDRRKQLRA